MKAADYQYQQLLEQTTTLYNSEKEIIGIIESLYVNADDSNLKEEISREAEESKRHCTRLEGLMEHTKP